MTKSLQKIEDSKNNLADQLGGPKYNYDNMFQTGEIGKTYSRLKNELQIAENCETNDYLNYFLVNLVILGVISTWIGKTDFEKIYSFIK